MTDVKIAVSIIEMAHLGLHDTAYLISGDSDLVPAIQSAKRISPKMRFIAAFPPERSSKSLKQICDSSFVIGRQVLRKCQFPDSVVTSSGVTVNRPAKWK